MASRFSVEGRFSMVDRITRPIRRVQRRIDRFTRRTLRNFRNLRRSAREFRTAFQAVGAAVVVTAALIARALLDVIEVGRDFDQTLVSAAARFAVPLRRGTEAFRELEEAAMRTGSTTEFSASQAAEAIGAMAQAGFSAEQSIAALPGVVDLATAAQLELGEATSIAADALGQWGLMTDDAVQLGTNLTRINDVLARSASSANLTVQDLSEAFRTAAPTARGAGASLETLSAELDVLAASGIRGAEAGTAMRGIFLRLAAPTSAARAALRRLRIEVTDGQGNLRDSIDIFADLQRSMEGMGTAEATRALNIIFGARASTAAGVLRDGADQARQLRTALEGAGGAAGDMAAMMRDTATGDIAGMNSAIEGLQLQIWDLIRGPVRAVVQAITAWVRANQDAISGGLRDFIAFLTENMPTIALWATRIGQAFVVVGAILGPTIALFVATLLAIPAAVIGVIALLIAAWDAMSETVFSVGAAISETFLEVTERVASFFQGAIEFIVGLLVLLAAEAGPVLIPLIDAFVRAKEFIQEAWRPIGEFYAELWGDISSGASSAWDAIASFAGTIAESVMEAWGPVGEFFSNLWAGIAAGFDATVGSIIEQVSGFIESVQLTGRAELDSGGRPESQVASPTEAITRSVTETTRTNRGEVVIRDESGRAEVTRPTPGVGLVQQPSGAF